MTKEQLSLSEINLINFSLHCILVGLLFQFGVIKVSGNACGTIDVLVSRISGGEETERGEWPFLAALYYLEKLQFFCGGTIISERHVLSGTKEFFTVLNPLKKSNFSCSLRPKQIFLKNTSAG